MKVHEEELFPALYLSNGFHCLILLAQAKSISVLTCKGKHIIVLLSRFHRWQICRHSAHFIFSIESNTEHILNKIYDCEENHILLSLFAQLLLLPTLALQDKDVMMAGIFVPQRMIEVIITEKKSATMSINSLGQQLLDHQSNLKLKVISGSQTE